MRIALARYGYSATGGAEAYLVRLAAALVERGESVVLYTSQKWPAETWNFGEIQQIPARSPMAFANALKDLKKDADCLFSLERVLKCDIYRAGDGVHAAWLQRRMQFEPQWRSWFRHLNPKHRQLLELEKRVFDPQHTGVIVANSRMVQVEISQYYSFPKERVLLVYNGFKAHHVPAEDRTHIRRKYGFSPDEVVVLFSGTGWERKGLHFAIQAVNALHGRARLLVAGKGPSQKYTSPYAVFAGPVSGMSLLYEAADIFIAPTLYDPFSNACLEAFAAGLPVITTDANGFSELLENSKLGDRVAVGDTQGFIEALERWLPREIRESTRQNRIEMAKQFSMQENVRKTLDAIRLAMEIRKQSESKKTLD